MEEITGILQQLIDMVKSTAPVLWAIYVKQAYVVGFQYTLSAITLLAVGGYFYICSKKSDLDDEDKTFFGFLCASCILICVILIAISLGRFINPEYYAIKMLIDGLR